MIPAVLILCVLTAPVTPADVAMVRMAHAQGLKNWPVPACKMAEIPMASMDDCRKALPLAIRAEKARPGVGAVTAGCGP